MNDFYREWFSRPRPDPPTPEQMWERTTRHYVQLAESEWAEAIKQRFHLPQVEKAEQDFGDLLKYIEDPELRDKIDVAAGQLIRAYEVLGFCSGRFSCDSRAAIL